MTHPPEPGHERFIGDLASKMDRSDTRSMVFSMSTYQVFDEDAPTAVLAHGAGNLGLIMWNLLPGQENDYHLHPKMEHLQVIVQGEVEYTLGGGEPVTLKVGDAVMVPPGVPHGIRNVSDAPASYFAVTDNTAGSYEKIVVARDGRAGSASA